MCVIAMLTLTSSSKGCRALRLPMYSTSGRAQRIACSCPWGSGRGCGRHVVATRPTHPAPAVQVRNLVSHLAQQTSSPPRPSSTWALRSVDEQIKPVPAIHRGRIRTLDRTQRGWLKRPLAIDPVSVKPSTTTAWSAASSRAARVSVWPSESWACRAKCAGTAPAKRARPGLSLRLGRCRRRGGAAGVAQRRESGADGMAR